MQRYPSSALLSRALDRSELAFPEGRTSTVAQRCKPPCDMSPLNPLLQAQGGAGSGTANSPLAPAMAPSTLNRAARDRQRLLLKGDRDSAVPSLACAESPGVSNWDEQSAQSSSWTPAWPRGKRLAQHRARLPLPRCAVRHESIPIPSPHRFSGSPAPQG